MSKYKIVIADDHAMVRDGVRNLIKQNKDYSVIGEATCGREALALFDSMRPDLLILDISMPDMNGMEVSREILHNRPDANIIILSMYDDEDYVSRCLEVGVKGYVVKERKRFRAGLRHTLGAAGRTTVSRHAQNVIFKKYTQTVNRKKQREELISLPNGK